MTTATCSQWETSDKSCHWSGGPLATCGGVSLPSNLPLQEFNLKDVDSVLKVVRHSNVVINLIGRDHETRFMTSWLLYLSLSLSLAGWLAAD